MPRRSRRPTLVPAPFLRAAVLLLLAGVMPLHAADGVRPGRCAAAHAAGATADAPPLTFRGTRQQVGEKVAITAVETMHPYRLGRGSVRVEEIHVPGASYVAPYFSRFDLAPGDHVIVRSPSGDRAWRYEGEGKPGLGRSAGFWGIHIPGERLVIELHGAGRGEGWGYRIDTVARGLPIGRDVPNPICGEDDKENARCYAQTHPVHYQQSRAVARLLVAGTSLCTGWLIGSEGHLMTNGHCIESAEEAANTDYEFMAEGACAQTCGTLQCPGRIVSTSGTLVRRNYPDLDYALVRLDHNPGPQYGYLKLRASPPSVGEQVYLPQHPGGWGKQVALFSSHPLDGSGLPQLHDVWPDVVRFLADINYGTSGSPVLDHSQHCVVALQFGTLGCEDTGDIVGNVGMRSDRIIADLGALLPADAVAQGAQCRIRTHLFADGFD